MSEKISKSGRGGHRPNAGRRKGSQNKLTADFKETVRRLLDENSQNVQEWLNQVATGSHGKDPAPEKALDLLCKLAEYAVPKLARTEVAGENGGPLTVVLKRYTDA